MAGWVMRLPQLASIEPRVLSGRTDRTDRVVLRGSRFPDTDIPIQCEFVSGLTNSCDPGDTNAIEGGRRKCTWT